MAKRNLPRLLPLGDFLTPRQPPESNLQPRGRVAAAGCNSVRAQQYSILHCSITPRAGFEDEDDDEDENEASGEWRPMWDLNLSVLRFTFAPLRPPASLREALRAGLCVRFFLRLPFCAFRLRFQIQAQAAEKAPYPWCDESCCRSATAACSAFGQGRPSSRYNWINRSDLSSIERRMACENPFLIDGFHFSV